MNFGRKNELEAIKSEVVANDIMIVPAQSLISDMLLYQSEDNRIVYYQSDITLMKQMSENPNISPAVADELRVRNELRDSSPANNLSDSDILAAVKSRYLQSNVELQRFREFLNYSISNVVDADKREALRQEYESFLGSDVRPDVTTNDNTTTIISE